MKFSLILPTVARTTELARFLAHLDRQEYRNFEVIVVDQNPDGFLDPVLAPYREHFPIVHLKSPEKGLSRARNIGLQSASGDVIAFPDDDCWYPPDLLERVAALFDQLPRLAGVAGYCMDPAGRGFFRLDRIPGRINKFNVWSRSTSATIFLRQRLVQQVGLFDEGLGVGSGTLNAAAEDVDYMIRAIETGMNLTYRPDLRVFHPVPTGYGPPVIQRGYGYGRGAGFVLRRHHYPLAYVVYVLFRALAGAGLALLTGNLAKARYHYAVLRGRSSGWLE